MGLDEDSSKREKEGLQDCSETCDDVWFGDCGTNRKTGGGAGGDSMKVPGRR